MADRIVSLERLQTTQQQIEDAFSRDCQQRARQAKFDAGIYASGQYFDESADNQRGLHGTAAAVRVLGASSADPARPARPFVAGLVTYLTNRREIELARAREVNARRTGAAGERDEVAFWLDKLRHDSLNTSKQSDLLYALQHVPPEVAPTDELQKSVVAALDGGRALDGHGWGWTLDSPATSHELATAYVIRALARRGRDVGDEAAWLLDRFQNRRSGDRTVEDLESDCLVLDVLLETRSIPEEYARDAMDEIWPHLAHRLDQPRTVLKRFNESGRNHWVLIHWQLSLVALAARLRPWRYYLSKDVQGFLSDAVESIAARSSLNPSHDGAAASTRHYGYTFDAIDRSIGKRPRTGIPDRSVAWAVDRFNQTRRVGIGAAVTLVGLLALSLLIVVGYSWLSGNGSWYGDLGPELSGAAIVGIAVSLWYRWRAFRRRR